MFIENKLKNLKNEIPKSPSDMKEKVMNLVSSSSPLHIKRNFVLKIIFAVPSFLLIMIVSISMLVNSPNMGSDNNVDFDENEFVSDNLNEFEKAVIYSVYIINKTSYGDVVTIDLYYGYREDRDASVDLFDQMKIDIVADNFDILSKQNYSIENFNEVEYAVNDSYYFNHSVSFEIIPKDLNLKNGTIIINLFNTSSDHSENGKNITITINYIVEDNKIIFD